MYTFEQLIRTKQRGEGGGGGSLLFLIADILLRQTIYTYKFEQPQTHHHPHPPIQPSLLESLFKKINWEINECSFIIETEDTTQHNVHHPHPHQKKK